MATQAPSTLNAESIDLGNIIAYYTDTVYTSFSAMQSATDFKKLGLLKDALQLDATRELLKFYSGVPARTQKQFVTSEEMRFSGQMAEFRPRTLHTVLGGPGITETVKASSPAPTTVATGSTASVVNFADATGYAVGDEVRIGDSGSYQYGYIGSISTNAVTLLEPLGTAPTTGHAVAKIDEVYFDSGALALPTEVGIKLVKTLINGDTFELYAPKCQPSGSISLVWQDNTQTPEAVGIPFDFEVLSDPNVESGKTSRWIFTQA